MVCSRVNPYQSTSVVISQESIPHLLLQAQCLISAVYSPTYNSVTLVNNKLAAPITDLLISGFMALYSRVSVCFLLCMFKSTEPLAGHVGEGRTNTAYHPLLIVAVFTATP